ncbi:hypothetical protein SK128_017596 [Halocaridina rubra]|uniref:MADF domain-containing protein n=1 Tax=Halocaridina rubra TaxID=373956 RepID=A0AAN8WZH0_HALRR
MNDPWPREKIFALIDAFRYRECLWNKSAKDYTDRMRKDAAWADIAINMGCDVRTVEKKVKTLRTQFMNYYKQANKRNSELGQDETYTPKWFAYNALKFLLRTRESQGIIKDSIEAKKDENGVDSDEHSDTEDFFSDNEFFAPNPTSNAVVIKAEPLLEHFTKEEGPPRKTVRTSERLPIIADVETMRDQQHQQQQQQQQQQQHLLGYPSASRGGAKGLHEDEEEYELFGKCVASHLKRLPTRSALECQAHILNYLINKRLDEHT